MTDEWSAAPRRRDAKLEGENEGTIIFGLLPSGPWWSRVRIGYTSGTSSCAGERCDGMPWVQGLHSRAAQSKQSKRVPGRKIPEDRVLLRMGRGRMQYLLPANF